MSWSAPTILYPENKNKSKKQNLSWSAPTILYPGNKKIQKNKTSNKKNKKIPANQPQLAYSIEL